MLRLFFLILAVAVVGGCSDTDPLSDLASTRSANAHSLGPRDFTIMTWNLYVGGNVDEVIAAPADQIPFVAAEVFATVLATDFPTRAVGIANQIELFQPQVVGLQEVSLIRTQTPGDVLIGNPVGATDVVVDFLAVLVDELAGRGLDYRVVSLVQDTDVELPMATNFPLDDVRLNDSDVILVRGDVEIVDSRAANFAVNFSVPVAPGLTIDILRGWTLVDVAFRGRVYRVINTHLEPDVPEIQVAQAYEMLELSNPSNVPTFIIGDLNTNADGSGTATYSILTAAGFTDVWDEHNSGESGFTCCNQPDLQNPTPLYEKRIDLILFRDSRPDGPDNSGIRGAVHAQVVGDALIDRVGGLWPSDHAGVVASLSLPPGQYDSGENR